jgi:hypothetical protein
VGRGRGRQIWLAVAATMAGAVITLLVTLPGAREAVVAVSTVVMTVASVVPLIQCRDAGGSGGAESSRSGDGG